MKKEFVLDILRKHAAELDLSSPAWMRGPVRERALREAVVAF